MNSYISNITMLKDDIRKRILISGISTEDINTLEISYDSVFDKAMNNIQLTLDFDGGN